MQDARELRHARQEPALPPVPDDPPEPDGRQVPAAQPSVKDVQLVPGEQPPEQGG